METAEEKTNSLINSINLSASKFCLTGPRFALLLALLIFVQFPQVLLGLQTFVVRDYGFFAYPLAHFQQECFWRGELPSWNPYNNCGPVEHNAPVSTVADLSAIAINVVAQFFLPIASIYRRPGDVFFGAALDIQRDGGGRGGGDVFF